MIRLHGAEALPASFLTQSISLIESSIFESEYEELAEIFSSIEGISSIVQDACYHRITKYKGNSLLFQKADEGSIVLFGVCAALAYWIVQNTVGESFKEAYKESDMHKRLKCLFLSRLPKRQEKLGQDISQKLWAPVSDPKVISKIGYEQKGSGLLVDLQISKFDDVPPTPDEWCESEDKGAND
mgnify:CR=1 FL=1